MTEANVDVKPLKKMSVLIADDDPPTRILLRAAITQWGYQVIEAKDGLEAWEVMQSPDAPELLILDWIMPQLDGVALCQKIKKELTIHPFIILLTQLTGATNVLKGLDAGADEFLSKPFNMAELRSRLSIGARMIQNEHVLQASKKMTHEINDMANKVKDALFELQKSTHIDSSTLDRPTEEIERIIVAIDQLTQLHK